MGLTSIPTLTDESLGRLKIETAVPDLDRWIAGAEYNRLRQKVIELFQAVGLDDGTTDGSLEARIAGASRIYVFDDLDVINASARFNAAAFGGTGDAGQADPGGAPASARGYGWAYLAVQGSGDSALLIQTGGAFLPPTADAGFKARVQLPSTPITDWRLSAGLSDDGATCFVKVRTKTDGTWELIIQTSLPDDDTVVLPGLTAVAGALYEIEIRIIAETAIVVTVNGVSYTYTATAQIMSTDPAIAPVVTLEWVASSGGTGYVDYIEISGTRT